MRILLLCLLVGLLCSGQMCGDVQVNAPPIIDPPPEQRVTNDPVEEPQSSPAIEPGTSPSSETGDAGSDPSQPEVDESPSSEPPPVSPPSDGGSDTQPPVDEPPPTTEPPAPALMCHNGVFLCSGDPQSVECGIWDFEISISDAVIGTADLDWEGLPQSLIVTLSGIIDPGAECIDLVLTTDDDGYGTMRLCYDGPGLSVTGDWSFTSEPGPTGLTVSGATTGTSCESWE